MAWPCHRLHRNPAPEYALLIGRAELVALVEADRAIVLDGHVKCHWSITGPRQQVPHQLVRCAAAFDLIQQIDSLEADRVVGANLRMQNPTTAPSFSTTRYSTLPGID
jgi:hypothetical protein